MKEEEYWKHSKEADLIVESKPPWIIRWGATILFVIIVGIILIISFMVDYTQPDNPDSKLIDFLLLPLKSVFMHF